MPKVVIRNRCKVGAINGERDRARKIAPPRDWPSGSRKRSWARGVHSGKLHFDRPSFYFNLSWIYVRIIGKRTRGEKNATEEMVEPFVSRKRYIGEGKVARFTRVVSRRPLANYNSICISSNKSRLSSHLCRHIRRVFSWILHLLTSRRGENLSRIPTMFFLRFNERFLFSLLREIRWNYFSLLFICQE